MPLTLCSISAVVNTSSTTCGETFVYVPATLFVFALLILLTVAIPESIITSNVAPEPEPDVVDATPLYSPGVLTNDSVEKSCVAIPSLLILDTMPVPVEKVTNCPALTLLNESNVTVFVVTSSCPAGNVIASTMFGSTAVSEIVSPICLYTNALH